MTKPAEEWNKPNRETLVAPTYWPAIAAFGLVAAFSGLVTMWEVGAMGVIVFAAGLTGWIGRIRKESKSGG